jgi:hypothetical protein
MSNQDEQRLHDSIVVSVSIVVDHLARCDYDSVERITRGKYLDASQLEEAVRAFGYRLIEPPLFTFDELQPLQLIGVTPPTFDVRFPLWTVEHGKSPFVLTLRLPEEHHEDVAVQIMSLSVE